MTNSVAPSYWNESKIGPGVHLDKLDADKTAHHAQAARDHRLNFIPVAIDRLGGFSKGARRFLMHLYSMALDNGHSQDQARTIVDETRQRMAISTIRSSYNIYRQYANRVRRRVAEPADDDQQHHGVGAPDID